MNDPVLQLLTRGVFILVFCLTLVDFFRWRDLAHLEVAALFGGLALTIVLQAAAGVALIPLPAWATTASVVALLAQPYLLLRVLMQFRPVPRLQHAIGLIGVVASCALYVAFGASLPTWGTLALVVAFVYVEGYATAAFAQAALVSRGLSQRRLIAVALGSGCLALAIVLAGVMAAAPGARALLTPVIDVVSLGSAVGYYAGLAPPGWLRRTWQGAEVRRFLLGLSGLSGNQRTASTLEYLGPAAARAMGGTAAILGLSRDDNSRVLDLFPDTGGQRALAQTNTFTLTIDRSPVVSRAWQNRACAAVAPADDWGWELRQLGQALGARGLLIAPLAAGQRVYGVFLVFVNRASLFVDDDLAVLTVLADQAALAIESGKLLESSIRERSTLAAVMSSMHEGLVVTDTERVIRYCNARASEVLGLAPGRLIGSELRTTLDLLRPRLPDPDAVITQWKRALREPDRNSAIDFELSGPPQSVLAEVFSVSDASGGPRGIGIVLRDVTAERDLVRTKDELVSVVSHELRTPLASVVGFAELLRTRELGDAQRQQFLTVILEEGRRLTALINDFLDLQRMESGRQEISARRLELAELLEQSISAAGVDPARPIELNTDEVHLPDVWADSDRVRQVMANLLANARKYSPGGGSIHVSVRQEDGQAIVCVSDNGLGLPPEALPRLFEKFFRVDNSDRRSITGTGLGLAISRKIIEAHGGRIWAESEGLGRGSRFLFSLPVADVRNVSGDVLIVEDDPGFARLLEAELASRGISVVWVASAEEALEQLEIDTPQALVLDLLLPGLQGEEFLRRLCERDGWHVPVVIVTVKDLNQVERAAFNQLNVEAILRKEPTVGATAADILEATVRHRTSHGVAA